MHEREIELHSPKPTTIANTMLLSEGFRSIPGVQSVKVTAGKMSYTVTIKWDDRDKGFDIGFLSGMIAMEFIAFTKFDIQLGNRIWEG